MLSSWIRKENLFRYFGASNIILALIDGNCHSNVHSMKDIFQKRLVRIEMLGVCSFHTCKPTFCWFCLTVWRPEGEYEIYSELHKPNWFSIYVQCSPTAFVWSCFRILLGKFAIGCCFCGSLSYMFNRDQWWKSFKYSGWITVPCH